MLYLSKETQEKLKSFPELKTYVESFMFNDGKPEKGPLYLTDLTIFIKKLRLNIPKLFGWKDEPDENEYNLVEEFYSWGHNSRWGEVVEPYIYSHFEKAICNILERLQKRKNKKIKVL